MNDNRSHQEFFFDSENPWPGLYAFNEAGKDFFNGRDKEVATLLRLVHDARLVVLHGRSGRGKSSLLQAGLFPCLRDEHYLPVLIRLDFNHVRDQKRLLIDQVKDAFLDQLEKQGVEYPALNPQETLWEYLHRSGLELWSRKNFKLTPVFVFDQFEEIFTTGTDKTPAGQQFRADLADLIENLIPGKLAGQWEKSDSPATGIDLQTRRYTILLSFREDFLPKVEGWRYYIPSLMHNHLRLRTMNGVQAFDAVYKAGGEKLVDKDISYEIVRFVATSHGDEEEIHDQTQPEDSAIIPPVNLEKIDTTSLENMKVEPALLSLMCFKLNEKRKREYRSSIDNDLLKKAGHNIINEFYEDCMRDIPITTRRFIEEKLIFESGFRSSYPKTNAIGNGFITEAHLETLVRRRLLRVEPRMGHDHIELVHDLLTDVIRKNRNEHHIAALRQKARRHFYLSLGMGLLGVIFFVLAVVSISQTHKVHKYQTEAETLANFMLVDLKDTLEPMGRLDLIAPVAEKVMNYYSVISPSDYTDTTWSNRAMAMRTLGQIELAHGNLIKALGYSNQVLKIRTRLVNKNIKNTERQEALSETYTDLGDIEQKRGNLRKTRDWYNRAYSIRFRLARTQPQDPDAQKNYAVSLRKMGEAAFQAGDQKQAYLYSVQARNVLQDLLKHRQVNPKWQAEMVDAYANLGDIERTQGMLNKASEDYTRGYWINDSLLKKARFNPDYRKKRALFMSKFGEIELAHGNLGKAQGYYQQNLDIRERLVRRDPDNTDWQQNLSTAYSQWAEIEQTRGNLDRALEYSLKSFEINQYLVKKDPDNTAWQQDFAGIYDTFGAIEQERGHQDEAWTYFQYSFTIRRYLSQKDPANAGWQQDLAFGYYHLGAIEQARCNLNKAEPFLKKGFAISKNLAEKDPTNPDRQQALEYALHTLGDLERTRGRPKNLDQAQTYYQHAFQISKYLTERDPTNIFWQHGLAVSYNRLGIITKERHAPDIALDHFQNAFMIIKRLRDQAPDNTSWQRELAVSYFRVGDIEQNQGKLDKAGDSFRQAFRILQHLADKDPANTDWQRYLGVLYRKHGEIEQAAGNRDTALKHFQQSLMISKQLLNKNPKNDQWQKDLEDSCEHIAAFYKVIGEKKLSRIYADQAMQIHKQLEANNCGI